ncbi:MAG: hypothetical protein QM811_28920 [Pirellulales bacterium]
MKAALTAAAKSLADADAAITTANEKTQQSEAAATQAREKKAAAEKAKADADSVLADATKAKTAADALKVESDKRAKDATDAAKPKALNFAVYTRPVTVAIAAAPMTLTADRQKVELRANDKLEIPLKIVRSYGFDAEVKIGLASAEQIGVKAAEATIPKDQTEAKVVLDVGAAPKVGEHVVQLRAKLTFNGQPLQLDVPLQIVVLAP